MQVIILVTALVAALFLVLLQLPVPGGGTIMPALGAAWAAGLPLALLVASAADLPELPEAAERLLPDSEKELDDERRDAIWCALGWQGSSSGAGGMRQAGGGEASISLPLPNLSLSV